MPDTVRSAFTGWGRVVDYLFGRNALIGLASAMLLLISGYATWSGMNDFIVGASASKGRDLPGGFPANATLHSIRVASVGAAIVRANRQP